MRADTLYKYRSLDSWKFVVDILLNKRLFAAPFHALNDPMEGRYYYFGDNVRAQVRRAIYQSKSQHRICSLSRTKTSTLLWSYYAGGHKGIAVGVKLTRRNNAGLEVRPVRYDNGIHLGPEAARRAPNDVALDILTQKQMPWQHEQEVRVFSPIPFVSVTLSELVLGCQIDGGDKELLKSIARRLQPRLPIVQLSRSMLDAPEVPVLPQ